MFNHGFGLYGDVWAAWAEGGINIIVTLCLSFKLGIIGILAGKLASVLIIITIWKPYYLFSAGLKLPVLDYWKGVLKYYIAFFISLSIMLLVMYGLHVNPKSEILSMIEFGLLVVLPTIIIYCSLLYLISPGMKNVVRRIIHTTQNT
jgi:hypothetical protein